MTPNKIINIQALRALAALNVVFFHIIFNANLYGYSVDFFDFLKGWGSNGVDLFFVISGFVMIYIQNEKNKSAVAFFKDRLVRIIPTYWLFCIAISLFLVILPSLFKEMKFSSTYLLSSMFFLSGILAHKDPIVFVGWTIEYEILFYLLFSLSLFFRSLTWSFSVTSFILLALVFFANVDFIVLEFIFGMIVGLIYVNKGMPSWLAAITFALGAIVFLASIILKDAGINRVVLYGLPSALVVFGCIGLKQINDGLLSMLGDASYSIYLIQIFTIPAFYKFAKALNLSVLYSDLMAILCLLLTSASGYFLYVVYEKRISNFLRLHKSIKFK